MTLQGKAEEVGLNARRLFSQPESDITVCGAGTLGPGQEGQQPGLAGRGGRGAESQALGPAPQGQGGGAGHSRPIAQERARSKAPGSGSLQTLTFPEAARTFATGPAHVISKC